MRIALTVVVSVALLAALNSHAEANQACISKATKALPGIAGLVIKTHGRVPSRQRSWRRGRAKRGRSSWMGISSPQARRKPIRTCVW
jgi:hypothetical protein